MGQAKLKVIHRRMRNGQLAGADITDPTEYFAELFSNEKYESVRALWMLLSENDRGDLIQLFDGDDPFSNVSVAQSWAANASDEEKLRAMSKIKELSKHYEEAAEPEHQAAAQAAEQ